MGFGAQQCVWLAVRCYYYGILKTYAALTTRLSDTTAVSDPNGRDNTRF